MANGGWGIVLVIIALAILTGFMVSAYLENIENEAISHAALKNTVGQLADAHKTATANANDLQNLQDQLATATAEKHSCELDNAKISNDLNEAQTGKAQAEVTIANQQATIMAMGQSKPPVGEASQPRTVVGAARTTPIPFTGRVLQDKTNTSLAWLPAVVLGFFVLVVAAAYRMLKIEDRTQGQAQ